MENAINFVRSEAEKHFSNSINCSSFHALLYHTSQRYYSGASCVHFKGKHLKYHSLQHTKARQ